MRTIVGRVVRDQQVLRFHVAVHDAPLVGVRQRPRDVPPGVSHRVGVARIECALGASIGDGHRRMTMSPLCHASA